MHEPYHHGPSIQPDGAATWKLWAPYAERMELILEPGSAERRVAMQKCEAGWFTYGESSVSDGSRYLFELPNGRRLPDPASRSQPGGVHGPSALFDTRKMTWTDSAWRGIALSDLAIYELHIGTFTPEGTLTAVIPRLPELRELGITALEIMPLAQFPGERGWGYDGVYPFAVQHSYGGPRALQQLVDACHQHGLAVLLDVVYNHFGPEGNYFAQFGPYFTEKHHTPWGAALNYDGPDSAAVRQFVLDNVVWWLREFHLDGLRLDAVHAILDDSQRHLLREIQDVAAAESRRAGRPIHIIAESNLNDVRLLNSPERGGLGLNAQWSDDFHHCVHTLLTGELAGYYMDFGQPEQLAKALRDFFVYDGCFSPYRKREFGTPVGAHSGEHFVIAIQNHDQVGNRALGERFGTLLPPPQQRLAATLLLLAPNVPLLFMGEEYGETRPFQFFCDFGESSLIEAVRRGRAQEFASFAWPERLPDPFAPETFASARLSWSWESDRHRSGLRKWYQTLLRARREWPALRNFVLRDAHWYPGSDPTQGVVELIRGDAAAGPAVAAYFNLSSAPQAIPPVARLHQAPAAWQAVLSSEQSAYDGARDELTWRNATGHDLLPYEAQIFTLSERNST